MGVERESRFEKVEKKMDLEEAPGKLRMSSHCTLHQCCTPSTHQRMHSVRSNGHRDTFMAPGTTKSLSDGRAEGRYNTQSGFTDVPDSDAVLQSLVSSLAPGESASADIPSKEDVSKLSDKLKQLLGDVDPPPGPVQRDERGEVCVYTTVVRNDIDLNAM
jgi:hypothetical protein